MVEAFVAGGGTWLNGNALAGGDKLRLGGNVYVDGYDSLRGSTAIPAGIHSNLRSGSDAIRWDTLNPTDQLNVSGRLTAVSDDADAIHLLGSNVAVDGIRNDQPYRRLPNIDVASLVGNYSGSPGAPLPPTGPLVLNGGDHYYTGDQTINGDVVLQNGARLVVRGNLEVNGSLRGTGAVLVDGNTKFYGDSEVFGDKTSYVSVLSSGHVAVSGFNGTAFLNTLASTEPSNGSTPRGQEAAELWQDVQDNMAWMQSYLQSHTDIDSWDDNLMDSHSAVLASGIAGWGTPGSNTPFVDTLPNQPLRNSMGALRSRLSAGAGPTQQFLINRMERIDDLFRAATDSRNGFASAEHSDWRNWAMAYLDGNWDPGTMGGVFDVAQSLYIKRADPDSPLSASDLNRLRNEMLPEMIRQIDQFNYNRIGAAQFRGLVYARGGIVASNEVTVLGSMVAYGDAAAGTFTDGGVTVEPGQVYLGSSSRFTYIKDMFENGIGSLADLGVLGVKSWRLR